MKKSFLATALITLLIASFLLGQWPSFEASLNVSVWLTWLISALALWVVYTDESDSAGTTSWLTTINDILRCVHVLVLAATGWFATATVLALATYCVVSGRHGSHKIGKHLHS